MTPTNARASSVATATTASTTNKKSNNLANNTGNNIPPPRRILLDQWTNPNHWRKLCPHLRISDDPRRRVARSSPSDDSRADVRRPLLKTRLIRDGYALLDQRLDVAPNDDDNDNDGQTSHATCRTEIARGISDLELCHRLPATFVLLFDETWDLARASCEMLMPRHSSVEREGTLETTVSRKKTNENDGGGILHPLMKFNYDVLAWHIDPIRNQAGFSPHRDRQPNTRLDLQRSFYPEENDEGAGGGQAKYVTHWVALTDATPENSCLYVIPRGFDPGYLGGDDDFDDDDNNDDDDDGDDDKHYKETSLSCCGSSGDRNEKYSDPLTRALPTKQSYQNIRALPRKAGQSVVFTHRILHWGSKGNPHSTADANRPRIAISFVYSDEGFEAPYVKKEYFGPCDDIIQKADKKEKNRNSKKDESSAPWTYPPFSIRLLLVCAQLLIYHQRFDLSAPMLRACYDYCKLHSEELNDVYRKKVFVEFVKAMKEQSGDGGGVVDGGGAEESGGLEGEKAGLNNIVAGEMSDGNNAAEPSKNDRVYSDDEEALLEEMLNHQEEFDDDFDDMECCESTQTVTRDDDSCEKGQRSRSKSLAKGKNENSRHRKKRRVS